MCYCISSIMTKLYKTLMLGKYRRRKKCHFLYTIQIVGKKTFTSKKIYINTTLKVIFLAFPKTLIPKRCKIWTTNWIFNNTQDVQFQFYPSPKIFHDLGFVDGDILQVWANISSFIWPCKSWTNARSGITQFVTQNTHISRHPGV